MARLAFSGFETGHLVSEGVWNPSALGSAAIESSTVRTGGFSAKYPSPGGGACQADPTKVPGLGVLDRTYFVRTYFRYPSFPTDARQVFGLRLGGIYLAAAVLQTDGTLKLRHYGNGTPAYYGSASSVLAANTWHMIEVGCRISASGNDYAGLRINTSVLAESSALNIYSAAPDGFGFGSESITGLGAQVGDYFFDDIVVNSDLVPTGFVAGQPNAQDSWPGAGSSFLLLPTADSARHADWLAGAGGTSSLFEALNNRPPVGVATGAPTNTSQVKDTTAGGTAEDLDLTLQTYDAAGVPAGDGILVVQTLVNTGAASSQAGMGAVMSVSNPAEGAETTFNPYAGAQATFPTGWTTTRGPMIYLPAVSKSVAPVLRIGKRGSSTARMDADLAGLYVDSGEVIRGGGRMWT